MQIFEAYCGVLIFHYTRMGICLSAEAQPPVAQGSGSRVVVTMLD